MYRFTYRLTLNRTTTIKDVLIAFFNNDEIFRFVDLVTQPIVRKVLLERYTSEEYVFK